MKFTEILETVNPYKIPKNEKEYKKFADKSKLPNIQNMIKSGQVIPTGGPKEIREPTSRQAEDKFEAIKNKVIKSSWFKEFLKEHNLTYRHVSEMGDAIQYSKADIGMTSNVDKLFKVRINIQTGLCYKFNKMGGGKNGWKGSGVYYLKNGEFAQDLGSESKAKHFILGKFKDWINKYTLKENKENHVQQSHEIKLDDNLIDLKNSIVNSSWFRQLLKTNKFKLSQEFFNDKLKSVEISIENKIYIFNWDLQSGNFKQKGINGVWGGPRNPQVSFPWKQINKKLTESKFREYLENDFFPNI